ncbi:MAG: hypothetical protein ACI32C_01675 [Candidatus Enteromonas sp.]
MKKKRIEELLDLAELNDGYVSVDEAKKNGIEQTYLCLGEEMGIFQKATKGLYIKKGYLVDPYFILHFRYRKAVFALRSALYLHGLAPMPEKIEVALPRNYMTSGIEGASCIRKSKEKYLLGLSLAVSPHGPLVPVYDKEMTVLDVILYRDRFEDQEYKDILDDLLDKGLDKEKLFHYAEELKVLTLAEAVLKGRI